VANDKDSPPRDAETISDMKQPWWFKGFVALVVGAVPPVTAAVYGYQHNKGQLELARKQHAHDVSAFYFKLAVDPQSGPELRQSVLRYLKYSMDDEARMQKWAAEELQPVEATVSRIVDLASRAAQAEAERDALAGDRRANEQKMEQLETKIASLRRQADNLRRPAPAPIEKPQMCFALKGLKELAGWDLGQATDLQSCMNLCRRSDGCEAVRWADKEYAVARDASGMNRR
jgi:hypothetical protein